MFSYTVCPSFAPLCLSVGVTLETRQGSRGGVASEAGLSGSITYFWPLTPSFYSSFSGLPHLSLCFRHTELLELPKCVYLFLAFHV